MSYGTQQPDMQQFEQIMATVFTCRSIVKYNLVLSEEQKGQLLADIDIALDALRTYLMSSTEVKLQYIADVSESVRSQNSSSQRPNVPVENESEKLTALYKMYRSYLDMQKSHNIQSYGMRFNEVMQIMNDLQKKCTNSKDIYAKNNVRNATMDEAFQCVIVFIADIYYMFMDFIRALSDIWRQSAAQPSTEKLVFPKVEQDKKTGNKERSLTQLLDAYAAQQKLDVQKGTLPVRVNDVVVSLEALKQNANGESSRYNELLAKVNNTTTLLSDLLHLVADYEKAALELLSANK